MPYDFSEEAKLTNEQLGDELAKVTPLTAEEVNKFLPKRADKERLKQLIQLVNSSASQNKKLASLTSNFAELGGVVLAVLTKFLKRV
jgi:hypothetical protein